MYLLFHLRLSVRCWCLSWQDKKSHYSDVIMGTMASQITSLTIVYSIVYSGTAQRKHQSSASLAFVRGIHRSPVNSPHKWPVTRKKFPFDDVIMSLTIPTTNRLSMYIEWYNTTRQDNDKTLVRLSTQEDHPIHRPHGWPMQYLG